MRLVETLLRAVKTGIAGMSSAPIKTSMDAIDDPLVDLDLGPMANFSEAKLLKEFFALTNAEQPESAAKYLIAQLGGIGRSGLNRQEKINHILYLPRLIQAAGRTKHGYNKLLIKARRVEHQIEGLELPKDGGFLDLGCGAHDPLGLASYYYLNGFDFAYAIDLLAPRNPLYSAFSMYDILVNVRAFPKRYCREGVLPGMVMSRIGKFPLGRFERGDFQGSLKALEKLIHYENVDVSESSVERESLRLLVSFAVLEHVSDINAVCRKLYDSLKPGGVAFHFIDMADHRIYTHDGKHHAMSFLTEDPAPPHLNRLRANQFLQAHLDCGFEILKENRTNAEMSDELKSQLLPQFAAMDERDVSATKMDLVVRKPGRQI